ncbi:NUDIX domain-containing protein [Geomicrobium sp. JCM 19039]|uniref:NUDIX domain-containing protein n=1 Tax=Geomicrobium sp. JCM 19039 TaxID=1460636 RepID=UPI00045F34F9|nr:NUDIX domain-containing protein [Geomicrobium sp. JCM 19039]GAK14039.1 MutT/Nudix family protein [Geomicrobium sp. JCM 19039]
MFTQNSLHAGIQVPKGTVESGEEVIDAAVRECIEETGIQSLPPPVFLAQDKWQRADGQTEERFFYHFSCPNLPDRWSHSPSGGGAETGLVFHFQWIGFDRAPLVTGHGDFVCLLQRLV